MQIELVKWSPALKQELMNICNNMVRVDDYLGIEKLTALTGDHPKYLGWVALERVLNQKPRV